MFEIVCFAIFSVVSFQNYLYFKAREKGLENELEDLRAAVSAKAKATPQDPLPTPLPVEHPLVRDATATESVPDNIEGVAVVCCLDGPGWMQKRYSMSVQNMVNALPTSWRVQLFHHGSVQSTKGINLSFGLQRLIASGKVILTEVGTSWKKRSRSEIYLSEYFWQTVKAERVLFFGHGGVQCQNSPYSINNFTDYDLVSSPDGGFV
jgi:hypothetical protein